MIVGLLLLSSPKYTSTAVPTTNKFMNPDKKYFVYKSTWRLQHNLKTALRDRNVPSKAKTRFGISTTSHSSGPTAHYKKLPSQTKQDMDTPKLSRDRPFIIHRRLIHTLLSVGRARDRTHWMGMGSLTNPSASGAALQQTITSCVWKTIGGMPHHLI